MFSDPIRWVISSNNNNSMWATMLVLLINCWYTRLRGIILFWSSIVFLNTFGIFFSCLRHNRSLTFLSRNSTYSSFISQILQHWLNKCYSTIKWLCAAINRRFVVATLPFNHELHQSITQILFHSSTLNSFACTVAPIDGILKSMASFKVVSHILHIKYD